MANNCLVTELKGIVDNDTLEKFGVLKLHVKATASPATNDNKIRVEAPAGYTATAVGAGYIGFSDEDLANEKKSVSDTAATLSCSNLNYDIEVKSKYEVTKLQMFTTTSLYEFTSDDLKYMTKLTHLSVTSNACTGTLTDLVNLSSMIVLNLSGSFFAGSLDTLGGMSALTELNVGYTGTRITGSVEDFAKKQYLARGNQAGSISLSTVGNTRITFNDALANSSSTLSWAVHSGDSTKLDVTYKSTTVVVNL